MYLTLDRFLEHFPPINMTRNQFAEKFKIMYSKPQTLAQIFRLEPTGHTKDGKAKTIIKKPETDKRYLHKEEVIDYFYEILINNRHKYLTCFYYAYFDFKDPSQLDWKTDKAKILTRPELFSPYAVVSSQKNDASRRMVRNLYYLELLDQTKVTNTVSSQTSFWQALTDMYNELKLQDRFFAPSSIDLFLREKRTQKQGVTINYNNLFYLYQAYLPKASIFNPYTIKWIMDKLLVPYINTVTPKGSLKILTPVLSWSSYLIAFMHSSDFNFYTGIDVMSSVCSKSEFLADWYRQKGGKFKNKQVTIHCQPSETVSLPMEYDCVLVCPPYYDMEIYPNGKQSIDTFPDYNSWLNGYWQQTVKMCYQASILGSVFAFIGNDYKTLTGKNYSLTKDLQSIVEQYYTLVDMVYLQNRTSPLRVNAKDRTERLYIYKKMI